MRIRLPMRRMVLFLAMLALAIVALLPLRLVLGSVDGLKAREASGSLWSGTLKEASVGPAMLGDLDARLSPLSLLVGQARLVVKRDSTGPDRLSGALGLGRSRRSVESVTGTIPVGAVFAPLPIGALELTDVTVRFRDGQCDRAEGLVKASISGDLVGLALPAGLNGAARCDRGDLLLPLTSGAGGEGLALRIFGNGQYEARLTLQATEPEMMARLTGAGFTTGPGGYAMSFKGKF